MKSKKAIVAISVSAVILAIVLALNIAVGILSEVIDVWVVGYKGGASDEAARAEGAALVEQIQQEGTVLVRNEGDLLPLTKGAEEKVNVFGWASVDWIYAGSGSGKIVGQTSGEHELFIDLYDALTAYGVQYNPDLKAMYERFQKRRYKADNLSAGNDDGTGALHSFSDEFSRLYEPRVDDSNFYTEDLLNSAKEWSDTALVVLGRITGESNDCPKVQYKKNSSSSTIVTDADRTYLEISTEEEALLKYVGDNYENVIVLINSTNVMELGFLEKLQTEKGLDACLIVATTGSAGATAIPKILYGEYSPSGRTADTFAYDLSTSSTYVNTGAGMKHEPRNGISGADTTNFYTNGKGLYPTTVKHTNGTTNSGTRTDYSGVAYTDYAEGIYLGYKWYETADKMGFWNSERAKTQWGIQNGYEDVVQYPFGFGLNYTQFSWEVAYMSVPNGATLDPDTEVTIQVKVTNTGDHAGQDVVELYYEPPYTQGKVEKASVNLLAFAKTQQVLDPGESETVALTFKVEDMKSYDCYNLSGKVGEDGGYVLERGEYALTLRTDAHTLAEDRLGSKEAAQRSIHIGSDTEIDGNTVKNRFTGSNTTDGVAIDGNSDGTASITYLSRADFAGTFPYERAANREMTQAIADLNLYTQQMANDWIDESAPDVSFGVKSDKDVLVYDSAKYTNEEAQQVTRGITDLGVRLGTDYDAEEWEDVLDAISLSEATSLVLHGYTKTSPIASIGKPITRDLDGPNQIGSFVDDFKNSALTGFSSIVLAQSWNLELAYSMGLTVARDAANNTISGWYGPGINVHRSPFGGRNYEYYSEDAYLSGMMSAYAVAAAKNAGVFSYLKHICLYESESGRDGMYNWLTEQALREVYIKPFELCVREHQIKDVTGERVIRTVGKATGIMTSYGRIGAVWTGGSEALLSEVVRGEWGFEGAFLTDYADNHEYMNGDQMIRAGGDLWMDGYLNDGAFRFETTSNSFKGALRRATKNVVYMWLNALATNKDYNEKVANGEIQEGVQIITSAPELNFRWYIPVLVVVDVLAVAGCGAWIFLSLRKKKEKKEN